MQQVTQRYTIETSRPADVLTRRLIFVGGKGGVGKTAVSHAIARKLAARPRARVLWTTFEDPTLPPGQLEQKGPGLWHLNCESIAAFEEYTTMKIGIALLAKVFLQNKLIRYLAKAAPGIHELVLLGKVWFERSNYDHIVCDMPSTGYGVAMFQSTENFAKLFTGGPVQRDARSMLDTFHDPNETGHLIVSIPEETPLRESIELGNLLTQLFPENPPAYLINRRFPNATSKPPKFSADPSEWPSPYAKSEDEYAEKRRLLEDRNLDIWKDVGIESAEIPLVNFTQDELELSKLLGEELVKEKLL